MKLFEAIEKRRSVHNFIPGRKIPADTLKELFRLATLAPSSWNLQPWKFLVIEDDARRAEIRKMAWDQPIITDSSALILVLGSTDPHARKEEIFDQWRGNGIIDDRIHEQWMGAVGAIYSTDRDRHEFAIRNSSFAAMTLMLAATGLGLVSCPMIGFDKRGVSDYVGLESPWILSFLIALGYNDGSEEFPRQQRFPFEDVVRIDTLD